MSTHTLTDDQLKVVERVQKLLNLAAKNPNEHEAESARAKAQEMMLAHNLEAAVVEAASGGKAKREEALMDGGFYAYQRDLWQAVAEVHFCVYWNQPYLTKHMVPQTIKERGVYLGVKKVRVMRRRHALIGRVVNTRLAMNMAQYLQSAVERALGEHLAGDPEVAHLNKATNYAHSFRKGAARRLVRKLEERHDEALSKERAEQERAKRAAEGVSTSRGITVAAFSKSEEEGNYDFQFGEGAWAKKQARIAKWAAEREAELAAAAQWAADHPEEARALEEKERKREERNAARRKGRKFRGWRSDGTDLGGFYAGADAAEKIGVDPQAEARGPDRRLA